jgi:hypothetical protein
MKWMDGTSYTGMWVNDIQNGMGKIVFPDGSYKEGVFENNVLIQEYSDGRPVNYETP